MSTKPDPQAELEAFIKANPGLSDDEIRDAFWEQRLSKGKDPALMRVIYDEVMARNPARVRALVVGHLTNKPKPNSRLN
jgi:BioD-like phosphotransacetylase family protein